MYGKYSCAIVVVMLLALSLPNGWAASIQSRTQPKNKEVGPCSCGIFGKAKLTEKDTTPLISKSYMNVTCDEEGRTNCHSLCTSLASASKERATSALCHNIEHADGLFASLFTQTCKDPWKYAGITTPDPICCHEKKTIACPGEAGSPKP